MKKQLLLLAGSAFILASCGSNNNPAQTQAQIDSTVNAKMQQHDAENAAKNDSTLKAIEKEKADAMSKEHATKTTTHTKTTHTTVKETTPPPPTQTQQDNKFDNRQPGNQNKTSLTPEQQKAQDDKFNRRK